jgi:hypothetical protein
MFGLSTKEVLSKAILNASKNKVGIYKQRIMSNIDVLNGDEEAATEEVLISVRREYLDEVANSVISTFDVSSPAIAARIQLALMSPALCGYEDIDISNGIMAGSLYAICYYAIKNKVAEPRDCVRLNHLQHDIMNTALAELDSEL